MQIPMVNINRLNTTSNISIPETIPECEFEESENFKEDFEVSTSLAYGAVDSANAVARLRLGSDLGSEDLEHTYHNTTSASRLRLGSDLGSIISESEDLERTYHNPIYEGNPIYETIKVKRTEIDLRPNSSIDKCAETSDHS